MEHFYTRLKSLQLRKGSYILCLLLIAVLQCLFSQRLFAQVVRIQVVNFSTTVGTFDLYANDSKVAEDLSLYTGTPLLEVPVGVVGFVATPGTATSIAEGIALADYPLVAGGKYIVVLYDAVENGVITPSFTLLDNNNVFSGDPANAEVAFSHVVPGAPAMDIVLRSGGMIVGNLGYDATTFDVPLGPIDNFLDVKVTGTANILGTYRLSLQGYEGKSKHVLMTGTIQNNNTLKLFSLDDEGFLFPVDAAPISRVQFINALTSPIDIFKNGTRFADNAASGSAMEYKFIPAALVMNIAICDQNSLTANSPLSVTPFTFQNMVSYTAVAGGTMVAPSMFLHHGSREVATDTNAVEILFFNGISSFPLVDVTNASGAVVFDHTAYGTYSDYLSTYEDKETFTIKDVITGNTIAAFTADQLQTLKGKAITMLLRMVNGTPSMFIADAAGNTVVLPAATVSTTALASGVSVMMGSNVVRETIALYAQEPMSFRYSIHNMTGQVMSLGQVDGNGAASVAVSDLPVGMYLLHVANSKGDVFNFKFIKE